MTTKIISIPPGQPLNTVIGSGPCGICLILKDRDESRTATIARTADRDLIMPIGINEIWVGYIHLICNGVTAADISLHMEAPAGLTGSWGVMGLRTTGPSFAGEFSALCQASFNAGNPIELGTAGVGDDVNAMVNFTVRNGNNIGNLNLFWAQRVSNATPTIIRANSFITAQRLQ